MARTLDDVKMQMVFPPAGKYSVSVIAIEKGASAVKKTPQITPIFSNGEFDFDDNLFVTEKTLSRLCLFAKRVCKMPRDTVLPDDDKEASIFVAKYIMANSVGKKCIVTIEEKEESFICESGPDIGQTKTIKKKRVAYNGYDEYKERQPGDDEPEKIEPQSATSKNPVAEEDLPF